MKEPEEVETKRISIDLPLHIVERINELKREWGHRSRGAVIERLLQEIFSEHPENMMKSMAYFEIF